VDLRIAGVLLIALGLVFLLAGRLPFDFSFGGDRWRVYLPLGTSLVVSAALTLLFLLLSLRHR
jgi:hypothetical protein